MTNKVELRIEMQRRCSAADLSQYIESSCAWIEALPNFQNSSHVLAYIPILSNEIPFVSVLQKKYSHKKWYVPEVVSDVEMVFVSFGTVGDADSLYRYTKNTCILVPSMALDRNGNRLGKGKGYYDRYLSEHSQLQNKTISVVPDFALLDVVPHDAHDVPMLHAYGAHTH
jgi:5-formyltetrahydrofolate cyclo-ligase